MISCKTYVPQCGQASTMTSIAEKKDRLFKYVLIRPLCIMANCISNLNSVNVSCMMHELTFVERVDYYYFHGTP